MSQSLAQLWVHIIFSTKNRRPFLRDKAIRQRLYDYITTVCHQMQCPILQIGGIEDHIHLLLCINKNSTLAKAVEVIKKSSSKWIKEISPELKDFYWQQGYGAFSVSQSNIDSVARYIEQQEQHHRKFSYKEELIKIFQKNHVKYDEKFLWN